MADHEDRRHRILTAAQNLIAERGYTNVGINDIGEALGLTGPSIYRYFPGKAAILVALHEQATASLLAVAHDAEHAPGATPETILRSLIHGHATYVVANPELYGLYLHERFSLPADDARRIRARLRTYAHSWRQAIAAFRPDLDEEEVVALELAVIGVIQSPIYVRAKLTPERLRDLLQHWAWQVAAGA